MSAAIKDHTQHTMNTYVHAYTYVYTRTHRAGKSKSSKPVHVSPIEAVLVLPATLTATQSQEPSEERFKAIAPIQSHLTKLTYQQRANVVGESLVGRALAANLVQTSRDHAYCWAHIYALYYSVRAD